MMCLCARVWASPALGAGDGAAGVREAGRAAAAVGGEELPSTPHPLYNTIYLFIYI